MKAWRIAATGLGVFLTGWLGIPAGHCVRAPEGAPKANHGEPKTNGAVILTPEQRAVAALAAQAGVQVEWNTDFGTPQSVRGANLGKRQAFSGSGIIFFVIAVERFRVVVILK